jgi:hypothetical protein
MLLFMMCVLVFICFFSTTERELHVEGLTVDDLSMCGAVEENKSLTRTFNPFDTLKG